MEVGPRPRLTRFLLVYDGSGGRTWSWGPWWALLPLNGLLLVVVVEAVDVALDWECCRCWSAGGCGRGCCSWECGLAGWPEELVDVGVPVPALPSQTRRCCRAALRAAALRCELQAASCRAALLGVRVAPSGTRGMGNPCGGETFLTRSRGGPGHGTLR